jgi:hypothetical protein
LEQRISISTMHYRAEDSKRQLRQSYERRNAATATKAITPPIAPLAAA